MGMTSPRARKRLVEELAGMGIRSARVLRIMQETPRHLFIDEALSDRAYENAALPIGFKQTISQPYTVARMLELLLGNDGSGSKILEIGTGCGYQTVILARLVRQVYSIERIAALADRAQHNFRALGLQNIHARCGDGTRGWLSHAPYDGIIVSAAPTREPAVLFDQLAPGGRLVLPIDKGGRQCLLLVGRTEQGRRWEQELGAAHFVPMCTGLG